MELLENAEETCFVCLDGPSVEHPLIAHCKCTMRTHLSCMSHLLRRHSFAASPFSCCVCKHEFKHIITQDAVYVAFDKIMVGFYLGQLIIQPSLMALHVFANGVINIHIIAFALQLFFLSSVIVTQGLHRRETGTHKWLSREVRPASIDVEFENGHACHVELTQSCEASHNERYMHRILVGTQRVATRAIGGQ